MMCSGISLVLLALAAAPSAHGKMVRGSSKLDAGMQPEVVARTLQQVEVQWQAEAYSFVKCDPAHADCSGTPNAFSKSCSTVIKAIVQGSDGDEHVAMEYMDIVCSQKIQGMHKQHCMNLKTALAQSMSADSYENRNNFSPTKLCTSFWSTFVQEEKKRFAKEEVDRIAAEKKAAEDRIAAEKKAAEEAAKKAQEAAEKKAAEEAAQKKAEEEAAKKAADELALKKIEDAKRVKEEAQAKAKEAAEKLAAKKAEAAEFAKKAAEKLEEAAEAEREHKKATDVVKHQEEEREQQEAKEAKDKSEKKEAVPKPAAPAPVAAKAAPAEAKAAPTGAAAPAIEVKAKTVALPAKAEAAASADTAAKQEKPMKVDAPKPSPPVVPAIDLIKAARAAAQKQ